MKVNWKVRFRNKLWLSSFISAILMIIYTVIDLFDLVPHIPETTAIRIVDAVLLILSLVGVIIDPTTAGLNDSARAQTYEQPWDDNLPEGGNG